jgi:hypothetical protein
LFIVEVAKFISAEFGLNILPNTLHHIRSRDPAIKSCKAIAIKVKRAEVTVDDIRSHFAHLFAPISGAPVHFLFDMDEMGHREWSDSTEKICFAPAHHSEDLVYYPVSRTGKCITLLACVAADGPFLKPAVVIPRKTYDEDLLRFGTTAEKSNFIYKRTVIFQCQFSRIGFGLSSFQSSTNADTAILILARSF